MTLLGFDEEEKNTATATGSALEDLEPEKLSLNGNRLVTIKNNVTPAAHSTSVLGNFSIVSYVQSGQMPLAILLTQHIVNTLPNDNLLIYALDLSVTDLRLLNNYCNNSSRCSIINYDLSIFPSFVKDQRMHAFRPIIIRDALLRYQQIFFMENYMRFNSGFGQEHPRQLHYPLKLLQKRLATRNGVLGWNSPTPVSARTHPKMFNYFQTDADNFYFLRMVDLDAVFFVGNQLVTEKILLPWLKCALTLECIDPIGKL